MVLVEWCWFWRGELFQFRTQVGFDVIVISGMLYVRCAGIDKIAGDLLGVAMFLELHAEVRRVCRIFFFLSEIRRSAVEKAYGRIVVGDEFIRRVIFDPWEDVFPGVVEHLE